MGNSLGDIDFEYIINISSVDPQVGSDLGGTVLTIIGENFCLDPLDNAVSLSNDENDIHLRCLILESTTTQITCVTPPLSSEIRDYTVFVTGKLLEEAKCTGDCSFVYELASTPSAE